MELTRRMMERVEVPCIDFPDNITAPMIGEPLFRRHCMPYYSEMAAMAKSVNPDAIVTVHMDGELRPLAKAIAASGVQGLDSFTPPPDCDLTVAEALTHWPDMRLFVNVPSSVHLGTPDAIKRAVGEILQQGASSGHLWLQISEDVPPLRWRESYPAIVEAVREFGEPKIMSASALAASGAQ
jgi:uroporphyrinogen-III decarboxylase